MVNLDITIQTARVFISRTDGASIYREVVKYIPTSLRRYLPMNKH
nr:hypothetical protein [Staphylococcus sp. KG4-3]MDW8560537.1 hypothetical protein [Staphylococcus sp. KG4-3]